MSFFDADHGDGSGRPLRDQIEGHLRAAGLATDGGAIRLFCMPRLGYGFNPLSVYFCYQRDGSLAAILYEVHNTSHEWHSYLIPVDRDAGLKGVSGAPGAVIDQHCRKGFYVSPFMDMNYTFRVAVPDQRVMVAIRAADKDGLLLAAALTGERMALTDTVLLRALATHPLLTLKVIGAIHWHALRLLLKGLKLRPRPRPPASPITVVNAEG